MIKNGLNANQIKLLACALMLVDHIGYLLLPQLLVLRIIGRLCFPLFAYMIANGYRHSSNRWRYLLRLAIFAVLFQPIYAFCMQTSMWNIFATLFLGLLAILVYDYSRSKNLLWLGAFAIVGICAFAWWLQTDYHAYGILLILTAYLFFDRQYLLSLSWLGINFLVLLPFVPISDLQIISLFALPILFQYNGQRGKGKRWFFYLFYCVHIPLLYLIGQLI